MCAIHEGCKKICIPIIIIFAFITLAFGTKILFQILGSIRHYENIVNTAEFKNFKTQCENYCKEFYKTNKLEYALMFCEHRFIPPGLENYYKNSRQFIAVTREDGFPFIEPYPVCEDAICCPHLFNCSEYGKPITLADCGEIYCRLYFGKLVRYTTKYPWGSCELPEDNNWWYKYFSDEVCREKGFNSS